MASYAGNGKISPLPHRRVLALAGSRTHLVETNEPVSSLSMPQIIDPPVLEHPFAVDSKANHGTSPLRRSPRRLPVRSTMNNMPTVSPNMAKTRSPSLLRHVMRSASSPPPFVTPPRNGHSRANRCSPGPGEHLQGHASYSGVSHIHRLNELEPTTAIFCS